MKFSPWLWLKWGTVIVAAGAAVMAGSAQQLRKQTLAPHELSGSDAPSPLIRDIPALPDGTVNFESAVTLRGGEYFFAPSIPFLAAL